MWVRLRSTDRCRSVLNGTSKKQNSPQQDDNLVHDYDVKCVVIPKIPDSSWSSEDLTITLELLGGLEASWREFLQFVPCFSQTCVFSVLCSETGHRLELEPCFCNHVKTPALNRAPLAPTLENCRLAHIRSPFKRKPWLLIESFLCPNTQWRTGAPSGRRLHVGHPNHSL